MVKSKPAPSKRALHDNFQYNNGHLYWKVNKGPVKVGDRAGATDDVGREQICFNRNMYYSHRLIWIYHFGDIPNEMEVDHINRNNKDNRIENLRLAHRWENEYNKSIRSDNTSGYKGVWFCRRSSKWKAEIIKQKKKVHIGTFENKEEAFKATQEMRILLHKEFHCNG